MVIDLTRGAVGTAGAAGFVGRGLLLISLGPSERGPDEEYSDIESDKAVASDLSFVFFFSCGFSRVS